MYPCLAVNTYVFDSSSENHRLVDNLIQGPTAGIKPLREAVANLYNSHHRAGKESQYTWENVCIVPGGRAGLIRIAAVIGMFAPSILVFYKTNRKLGNAYLGFFVSKASVQFNSYWIASWLLFVLSIWKPC
jgi:hypothetical protein